MQGRERRVGNESETADQGAQARIGAHLAQLHDVLCGSPLLTYTRSHLFAFAPPPSPSIFAGALDHQRAASSRQSVSDLVVF
jgi:hypothetical protein